MYAPALSQDKQDRQNKRDKQDKRTAQAHSPVSNGRVKQGFSPLDFFWDDLSLGSFFRP
jgi:hypothetical protein